MIQTLWRALGSAFLAVLQVKTGKRRKEELHYAQMVSRF